MLNRREAEQQFQENELARKHRGYLQLEQLERPPPTSPIYIVTNPPGAPQPVHVGAVLVPQQQLHEPAYQQDIVFPPGQVQHGPPANDNNNQVAPVCKIIL